MGTDTPQSTPPGQAASEERSVARNAGTVGAATMLSRALGLVREQVMAGFFGAGFATDAFNVAFRIPNLLRDLFAEGAMSSAFVPSFTAVQQQRGADAAWAFGRQLIATLIVVLGLVCVAGWFAAPWLVAAFAPGFAAVIDAQRLHLPDRPGNNRLDSLQNLIANPRIALLFLVPGRLETLRVNGTARLLTEPALLQRYAVHGKAARAVVEVEARSVYFQCGKAVIRAGLAPFAEAISDQIEGLDRPAAETRLEKSYRDTLY